MSKRRAMRFAIYINLLGGDPIPFKHDGYGTYELALQEQFAQLGQRVGHKQATEARKKGDALITRQGIMPTVLELFGTQQPEHHSDNVPAGTIESIQIETIPVRSSGEKRIEKRMCRRKLRHPHFLSALMHASRLDDPGLNIYECPICGGLHLGHATTGHVSRNRRIERRLQELAQKLTELDHQRTDLFRERRSLVHDRKKLMNPSVLKQMLRRILPINRDPTLSNSDVAP